jgi:microcystin-dependent protein
MDPFVAEIRMLTCNFAPRGWAFCDGQLLPISQNTALFSLLGTYFGGDGKSNFQLPNMQGNVPMGTGQGAGLSDRFLGEASGTQSVTLLQSEMPVHTHGLETNFNKALTAVPSSATCIAGANPGQAYSATTTNPVTMAPQIIGPAGGNLPHNNMQPYLTVNFCIALQGVYPPRT